MRHQLQRHKGKILAENVPTNIDKTTVSFVDCKKYRCQFKDYYEDNIEGKISDERFAKMSANYEAEQQTLESRTQELKEIINSEKENSLNADRFLKLVRKHTDIKELTAEVLRELVEKVYVYQSKRIDGKKVQRIRIIYNCIGDFQTPPTEHE